MPLADRWATRAQAEEHWQDSKALSDTLLSDLLEVAEGDCLTYGPALVVPPAALPDPMPTRWIIASIYQAKEIRDAGMRAGDVIGVGDYAIRSRPLTSTVMQLLRPRAGRGFTVA